MIDKKQCQALHESLSDYIDGILTEKLCAQLDHHLSECVDCRVVVNTLRKTIELYHRTSEGGDIPEDARERLFYRLDLQDFMEKPGKV